MALPACVQDPASHEHHLAQMLAAQQHEMAQEASPGTDPVLTALRSVRMAYAASQVLTRMQCMVAFGAQVYCVQCLSKIQVPPLAPSPSRCLHCVHKAHAASQAGPCQHCIISQLGIMMHALLCAVILRPALCCLTG